MLIITLQQLSFKYFVWTSFFIHKWMLKVIEIQISRNIIQHEWVKKGGGGGFHACSTHKWPMIALNNTYVLFMWGVSGHGMVKSWWLLQTETAHTKQLKGLTLPMLRLFCPKQKNTRFLKKHWNPVILLFIWKLSPSTLRWVPICQGFSNFSGFLQLFVLAKSATTSIRVNSLISTCKLMEVLNTTRQHLTIYRIPSALNHDFQAIWGRNINHNPKTTFHLIFFDAWYS